MPDEDKIMDEREMKNRIEDLEYSLDIARRQKQALGDLLAAVEPFRAFREAPDDHVARVSDMKLPPGVGGARLARLELAVRKAVSALS